MIICIKAQKIIGPCYQTIFPLLSLLPGEASFIAFFLKNTHPTPITSVPMIPPGCDPLVSSGAHGTAPFLYVAAAVGVTKTVTDVIARHPGPITGYQYAQAGGKHMDDTLSILNDKERGERAIETHLRNVLVTDYGRYISFVYKMNYCPFCLLNKSSTCLFEISI